MGEAPLQLPYQAVDKMASDHSKGSNTDLQKFNIYTQVGHWSVLVAKYLSTLYFPYLKPQLLFLLTSHHASIKTVRCLLYI